MVVVEKESAPRLAHTRETDTHDGGAHTGVPGWHTQASGGFQAYGRRAFEDCWPGAADAGGCRRGKTHACVLSAWERRRPPSAPERGRRTHIDAHYFNTGGTHTQTLFSVKNSL